MVNNTASGNGSVPTKRPRPCGNCRKRKRRCISEPGQPVCVLCKLYSLDNCTFDEQTISQRPSKRPRSETTTTTTTTTTQHSPPTLDATSLGDRASANDNDHPIRTVGPIEDYDTLQGPSLLKKNLGLQQHRFSCCNGPSGPWDPLLLDYCEFNEQDEYRLPNRTSIRRVSGTTSFVLNKYSGTKTRADELDQIDQIERLVAPHGPSLVNLYFRIVHPSFPILHKKVFLEKYARTHREFSPPCLGGVYLLALEWWNYDPVLSSQEKPNIALLELLVRKALYDVVQRPKLSTLQGGLLLLQHRPFGDDSWALSAQMVATMQELAVNLDCETWRVPIWEKGLRRRLAWSIYILDKWMALIHGRPSHIHDELDWTVEALTDGDFPEFPDDEDQQEGSGEVETGRFSFERQISLSQIVNESLTTVYSARAQKTITNIRQLLQVVKPIQIKLREWRRTLPERLNMESTKSQKTSANGSLHLAYYAAEITLHKAIILSLNRSAYEGTIVDVCRKAARERVVTATEFVKNLKADQLQSFWYFASGMNLVYIGTFAALLLLTSKTVEEARFYKELLKDYRWTLRVTSRAASFIDFAVRRLDLSLLHLDQLSVEDIIYDNAATSKKYDDDDNQGTDDADGELEDPDASDGRQPPQPQLHGDAGDEQQQFFDMLEAAEFNRALSDHVLSTDNMTGPDFFGRDWTEFASAESFLALDLSPS